MADTYMTPKASAYYLTRVLPFLNVAELTKRLKVSRPTVERMITQKRIMAGYQMAFENLLYDLTEEFKDKAKEFNEPNFYSQLADFLANEEQPKNVEGRRPKEHREEFIEEVKPLLKRKQGISSKEIMAIGQRYNLPKHRVHKLADGLGVTKDMRGQGRKATSTWYL